MSGHVLRTPGVEQLALTGLHFQDLAIHIAGDFYCNNGAATQGNFWWMLSAIMIPEYRI